MASFTWCLVLSSPGIPNHSPLVILVPVGYPEGPHTHTHMQSGNRGAAWLVKPSVLGEVCLESAAWPPWGVLGQLSLPQIYFWVTARGMPPRDEAQRDGQLCTAAPGLTGPAGCVLRTWEGTSNRARAFECVTFEGCPLETCVWGTGPSSWGQSDREGQAGMLSP